MPPWPDETRKPRRLPAAIRAPLALPLPIITLVKTLLKTSELSVAELVSLERKDVGYMPNRTNVVQVNGFVQTLHEDAVAALCSIAEWADGCVRTDWRAYASARPACALVPKDVLSDLALSAASIRNCLAVTSNPEAERIHEARNTKHVKRQRAKLEARRAELVAALEKTTKALADFDALFGPLLSPSTARATGGNTKGAAGTATENDELSSP